MRMLIQQSPSVWKAVPDQPELIPELVEAVVRKGGHFLIFKSEYISVVEAMRQKVLYEERLKRAMYYLSEYEAAKVEDKIVFKYKMISAIKSCGSAFRLYLCELNAGDPNRVKLEIPPAINALHEFKKYFGKCVYDIQTRTYSYQL